MADTVLKPVVIEEVAFPTIAQPSVVTSDGSNGSDGKVLKPFETVERSFPTQTIANTVIADSLNTQSRRILSDFSFGEYGSLAVGKYDEGVSGDIKISPAGIVARNKTGATTFTIDATTGDATFKGTLAANTIIASSRVYITERGIIVNDGTYDRIIIGEW